MNASRVLHALLFTPGPNGYWGLTPNLVGKPGTAKTASLIEAARVAGLPCRTIILSMREPGDQLGLPFVRPNGQGVGYEPPDWVVWANSVGSALIVFDEINTCSPQTQASALRILAEKHVGDVPLSKGIRFATAMNAVDDAAGGHDLAPSFANRLGWWPWDAIGVQQFTAWLIAGGQGVEEPPGDVAKTERQVLKAWDAPWNRARGTVAGFLQRRPDLLCKPPPSHDPKSSGPWPSLRTWEMATRALASAKLHGLDEDEVEHVVGMFVGPAAAGELTDWVHNTDLPDPAEVLDGKVSWQHDPERIDITAAVLTSCAALATSKGCENQEKRVRALWGILKPLATQVVDQAVPAGRALVIAGFSGNRFGDVSEGPLSSMYPAMKSANMV